eukprot:38716-Eustigmatos_ZCMA.PRE.1
MVRRKCWMCGVMWGRGAWTRCTPMPLSVTRCGYVMCPGLQMYAAVLLVMVVTYLTQVMYVCAGTGRAGAHGVGGAERCPGTAARRRRPRGHITSGGGSARPSGPP